MSAAQRLDANPLLAAALAYAARGWRVFPAHSIASSGRCSCLTDCGDSVAKHPRVFWKREATTDADTIRAWWTKWPDANVAITTGAASGLFVLDVDVDKGGAQSLIAIEKRYGKLPLTPTVRTGSGGWHYYCAHPGGELTNSSAFAGYAGIDTRGDGGYVIAPPSNHNSGGVYRFLESQPFDLALAPVPGWLLDLDSKRKPSGAKLDFDPQGWDGAEPEWLAAVLDSYPEIQRRFERDTTGLTDTSSSSVDMSLASLAAIRAGLTGEQLELLIRVSRSRAELPSEGESYYRHTIGKALAGAQAREQAKAERAEQTSETSPAGYEPATDTGNAERLVRGHGADLRHVHKWGRWLAWDGRRFAPDTSGEIQRRAKATARRMYAEVSDLGDTEKRKALVSWARKSESAPRIDAMIALARSEPGIPVAHGDLDADPWLFNAASGTVDLRTGELREHRRGDLLTKFAPVAYDPSAKAPTWTAFLERIMPEAGVRAFLRRAVGYSLSGDTGEQVLFLLWGAGANGKTTFIETLLATLGDYGMKTQAETLLAKRENAIPNDVAALRGARFVAAVESEEGRRLAEVRVKELTGGDTVSARFMRAEWFTFRPVCKLWLATNHRPTVRGTDEAIWRRIRLVPFAVTIPEKERDTRLLDRLRAELPGILAWAVEGCLEWQRDGLQPPDAVMAATKSYRAEQDVIGAFLADRCVFAPGAFVASADLYRMYRAWAEGAGERVMTQRALGLVLRERGLEDWREGKSRTRGWRGIGLLDLRHDPEGGQKADATT